MKICFNIVSIWKVQAKHKQNLWYLEAQINHLYMYVKDRYQLKFDTIWSASIQTYMSIQKDVILIPIERVQWYQLKQQ